MAERKKRAYLIDRILPHTEVHLIGGPSGAGKTRWLFQTLIDRWLKSKDVFGYRCHPCPWLYISGDRSYDDAAETLEQLGYDPESVPIYSAVDKGEFNLFLMMDKISEMTVPPKLLVIEGLASLTPDKCDLNKYKDIARFLSGLTVRCKRNDATILGVVHSPKMKEDAQYSNPRQRLMGSVAWAAYSGTVILIEQPHAGSPEASSLRRLTLLPRNAPEMYLDLQFSSEGRLVEVDAALNDVLFDTFLSKFKPGAEFKTSDALETMEKVMSRATVYRLIDAATIAGYIEKVSHGLYRARHKS